MAIGKNDLSRKELQKYKEELKGAARTYDILIDSMESQLERLKGKRKDAQAYLLDIYLKKRTTSKLDMRKSSKGDVCYAKEGDRVYICRGNHDLGREGTVIEKGWGCSEDKKGRSRWSAHYEVEFDEGSYLTMDHRVIRKVIQPKDEDFEKISSFFSQ